MSADGKYSLLNCGNLIQPIQMKLSKKLKPFCQFFFNNFWNLDHVLDILEQKYDPHSLFTSKVKDSERGVSEKSCFRRNFDKQHGERSQTLLKSAPQHIYHIYWSLWKVLSWKKLLLVICKI